MVSSRVYPDLERKPGGPDNWVEAAGGLPPYIERIAKHLHYEKGKSISHSIAIAVNTVKRWAKGGTVTKYGTTKRITPATQAKAAAAVASWEAKKKAGALALTEDLLAVIDLTEDYEMDVWFDLFDLAAADVDDDHAMVAFMLPHDVASKVAVPSGTPVNEMHVTVLFFPEVDDDKFAELIKELRVYAEGYSGKPLKGTIGGIGAFPAGEDGVPWFAQVDVPGLNTIHEQLAAVMPGASMNHGYTPHTTLTYAAESEKGPDPIKPVDVEFTEISIKRGGNDPVSMPLGGGGSADLTEHGTLGSSQVNVNGDGVSNLEAFAARANAIADPVERAAARAKVLDLASSIPPRKATGKASDGRPSYDDQGKWGHGFVPKDKAAREAKAKGSPAAMKRMRRLFGKKDSGSTGRAGSRSTGQGNNRAKDRERVEVDEKSTAGSEKAKSVGRLSRTPFSESSGNVNRVKGGKDASLPTDQKEASKSGRVPERARQNWDEIPDNLKTLRNGKRYVLADFGGKSFVTEWVGGVSRVSETQANARKVMRTLTSADAADMSDADLRALINNPKTPTPVRKTARAALKGSAETRKVAGDRD